MKPSVLLGLLLFPAGAVRVDTRAEPEVQDIPIGLSLAALSEFEEDDNDPTVKPSVAPTPAPTFPAVATPPPHSPAPTQFPVALELALPTITAVVDPAADRNRAKAEVAEAAQVAEARAEAEAKRLKAEASKVEGDENVTAKVKAEKEAAALKETKEQNKMLQSKARAIEEEAMRLHKERIAKGIADNRTLDSPFDGFGSQGPASQTSDRNVQISFRIMNVCAEKLDADPAAMNALVLILKQEAMTDAGLGLDPKSVLVSIDRGAPDASVNCSVEVLVVLPHPVGIAADLVMTMLSSAASFSQDLATKLNTGPEFAMGRTSGTITVSRHKVEAIIGDPISSDEMPPVVDMCDSLAGQICKVCAICVPCFNGKKIAADGSACNEGCGVCAVCNQYKSCYEAVIANGMIVTPVPTPEATVEPTPAPTKSIEPTSLEQLPYIREKGSCRDGGALGGFCKCGAIFDEEECFAKADFMFSMAVVEVFKGSHRGCNLMSMSPEKPADCPETCVGFAGAGKVIRLKGDGQDDKVCLIPKAESVALRKLNMMSSTTASPNAKPKAEGSPDNETAKCTPATSSPQCRKSCATSSGKSASTCHDMTVKKLFKAKVPVTLDLFSSYLTGTNEECSGSCSCTLFEMQTELTSWCMDDTFVDSHIQRKKDKVCPAICGDTCGRKKMPDSENTSICSGWVGVHPETGEKLGGFCGFHAKTQYPWCFIDTNATGYGMEFPQKSTHHPNKTWATCEADEKQYGKLGLFATEDMCTGWSPANGTWAGKGKTCDFWGLHTPWCFVDPGYRGSLAILASIFDGVTRAAAPCKVQQLIQTTTTTTTIRILAAMIRKQPGAADPSLPPPNVVPAASAAETAAQTFPSTGVVPAVTAPVVAGVAVPVQVPHAEASTVMHNAFLEDVDNETVISHDRRRHHGWPHQSYFKAVKLKNDEEDAADDTEAQPPAEKKTRKKDKANSEESEEDEETDGSGPALLRTRKSQQDTHQDAKKAKRGKKQSKGEREGKVKPRRRASAASTKEATKNKDKEATKNKDKAEEDSNEGEESEEEEEEGEEDAPVKKRKQPKRKKPSSKAQTKGATSDKEKAGDEEEEEADDGEEETEEGEAEEGEEEEEEDASKAATKRRGGKKTKKEKEKEKES
eukprot:TRINITY_DN700_c0_g1_i1.p1 TRINITY_DN700_c0_g1~~TRINITY_DN700_c0_g1_i1.p1  ORF type:complete len:1141 (+),score=257.08 TRINITY_DN700_c0_g1_i1:99-3521(+)